MLLDLKRVFTNEDELLPFEYRLDFTGIDLNGYKPFVSPVSVKGQVQNRAGVIHLDTKVEFDFSISCDRCMVQTDKKYQYSFSHVLVVSLNDEDNDSFIQVDNYQLDLDELIRTDILLELPTKFLCKPDCKGLCPVCGKNLNIGSCNCNPHQIDPRLGVLKQLID